MKRVLQVRRDEPSAPHAQREVLAPSRAAHAPTDVLLEPGRNCWRVERSPRFKCIQDGADYFRALRTAILAARKSVFILGWDISAGVDLLPGARDETEPTRLAELLDFVVRRRRELHCHVLIWDHAALYALERDPFTRLRLGWGTHRRVHFRFDDQHPYGASHHQKVIVIDDELAFSGGLDVTGHRWDTAEHRVDDPLRVNAMGKPYTPFHDVQAMVEGPAARALGELARTRWRRSGWWRPRSLHGFWSRRAQSKATTGGAEQSSAWPADVEPDLVDVDVAIARTEPRFRHRTAVRECEELFLDSIAAARRTIYVENQYFTSAQLGEALARRLREPDGPEVVVVGPKECSGWLEQQTMGALRGEVLANLVASDLHGRLRLSCAMASRERDIVTFIHSKILVVDDEQLRIGSANLSSRSLGMDTECDLVAVAHGDARTRSAITRVRDRLVAEHLGVPPEEVTRAVERLGSLRAAIDQLATRDHTLVRIEPPCREAARAAEPVRRAADPSEPMAVTRAFDELLPELEADERRAGWMTTGVPCATLVIAWFIVWRATDLGHWLGLSGLQELLVIARTTPVVVACALLAFVLAALLYVPLELLILACAIVFGPFHGGALSLTGTLCAALVAYGVGRTLGTRRASAWIGPRGFRLWRELRKRPFTAVAMSRLIPVAAATTVHVVCGAARVPLRAYLLGTLTGLLPGTLALCLLGGQLRGAILHPSWWRSAALVFTALALAFVVLRVRRVLMRRQLGAALDEQAQRARFG